MSTMSAAEKRLADEQARRAAPLAWTEPVSFDVPVNLPPFPLEVLPTVLRHYAEEIAESVQVPVDAPAGLMLAALSAATAGKTRVDIGETHSEPSSVYVALVAGSGERKTAVFSRIVAPLEEIEAEELERAGPEIARATERRKIAEERLLRLRKIAADPDNEEAKLYQQRAEDEAANLPNVPAAPRLIVADETPEHLGEVLAEQGGRIALFDPDASLFDILAGRYSERPSVEIYLKAHAGEPVRVGRKSQKGAAVIVQNPALTIGLCVQPSVLSDVAENKMFRGRGLVGRFLFVIPESLVGTRLYKSRGVSPAAAAAYRDTIRAIWRLPRASVGQHALLIEGEAHAEWETYHDGIERDQAEGGRLAGVRDWASKAAGAAARIAGLLHLVRYADCQPAAPWCLNVDADTTAAAVAIAEYLEDHALAALALMSTAEDVALAKRLLRWLYRHLEAGTFRDSFSLRDVHRHHQHVGKPEDLLPGLDVLEGRGFVRRIPATERPGPGRKSGLRFEINPRLRLVCPRSNDDIDRKEAIQ